MVTREHLVTEINSLTEQFATVQRQADQIIGARLILQRLLLRLDSPSRDEAHAESQNT